MYQPKKTQQKKLFDLDTVLTFGKYKPGNYMDEELTVKDVLGIEPEYIDWCIKNIEWFDITSDVDDELAEMLDEYEYNSRIHNGVDYNFR